MRVIRFLLVAGILLSGVPVIAMEGRVSLWFGIVALGPAISVTSIVNNCVFSPESVRVVLAH